MVLKSGASAGKMFADGVIVVVLFAVTVSPVVGVMPPEIAGAVPAVEAAGVIGTLKLLPAPLAIGPAVVQLTV